MPTGVRRRFLVTATPPTTNGDLHVGHLSGPYLAADVFCRAQRLLGNEALYVSGGDDHQTYVVTTAERLGIDPVELAADCSEKIRETLELTQIGVDAFSSPTTDYIEFVQDFYGSLYERGALTNRTYAFPYSRATGRFLIESFAVGYCPECYARTSGGVCEECGHPNDAESLLLPESSDLSGVAVERRTVEILVLPLERYRAELADFYRRRRSTMRPHVLRFVGEMLSRPLPDFPVTYPSQWGIPAAFGGRQNQVLNAWAEMLPALMWLTALAQKGRFPSADDDLWGKGSNYTLVQFLGSDNAFYFSMVHLALLFADQRLKPTAILTNEFLQLDGSKFSTSRGHLIWARDLAERYGIDSVRFYLALSNPEHQPANFTRGEFVTAVQDRLHKPLARIAETLAPHVGVRLKLRDADHAFFRQFRRRMTRSYALETFSLREAGSTLANLLGMLSSLAARAGIEEERRLRLTVVGLHHLCTYCGPLLPGFAARLRRQLGIDETERSIPSPLGGLIAIPRLEPEQLVPAITGADDL